MKIEEGEGGQYTDFDLKAVTPVPVAKKLSSFPRKSTMVAKKQSKVPMPKRS